MTGERCSQVLEIGRAQRYVWEGGGGRPRIGSRGTGVGDGEQRHVPTHPRKKIFFGQLSCKIREIHFFNFSGKNHKNSGILIIFGQESRKIREFVNFSYIFFRQKCFAPKVDWAPTLMSRSMQRTERIWGRAQPQHQIYRPIYNLQLKHIFQAA